MSDVLEDGDSRIRIMHGGPFSELMIKLGLRRRGWRALVFLTGCWLLPLLWILTFGSGMHARAFLRDWDGWARFAIAPALFALTERPISFAVDECTSILLRTPLVASQSRSEALQALSAARSRTSSQIAEATCLAIAIVGSVLGSRGLVTAAAPEWAFNDGATSGAGIWCAVVGNSLFWFLLARLVWKHLVWARFLSDISRCHLRLAITHPDNHAGVGFLGYYPAGYGLFVIAVSSLVAASVGHFMQHEAVTPTVFAAVCAIWAAGVIAYFILPLSGMAANVGRLKRKALLLSMAQAVDYERATERAVTGANFMEDEAERDGAGAKDVRSIYLASLKTSTLFVNKTNLLPIILPALLPILVVGAFFLPYAQLLPVARRLLLL